MSTTADRSIGQQAARQHGLITSHQALAHGLSLGQVSDRAASGRWIRVARGVYRIAGSPRSVQQDAMAALLTRTRAATSHLTTAALLGLDIAAPPKPWLIVPPGTSGRSSIATVRRRELPDEQILVRNGIAMTSGSRTLVDCSEILGPKRLGKLVDEAMHRRLCTAASVEQILDQQRDPRLRAGHDVLRDLIDVWAPTIRPGSPAEARLLRQLTSWGFPPPDRQIQVRDTSGVVVARLDGGWTHRRIGYEYDSVQWHGPAAWATDEERHALIEVLGWKLLHIDKGHLAPGATRLRDELVRWFAATQPLDAIARARA